MADTQRMVREKCEAACGCWFGPYGESPVRWHPSCKQHTRGPGDLGPPPVVVTLLREMRGLAAPTPDYLVGEVRACLHDTLPLGIESRVAHELDEDVPPGVVVAVIKTHGPPPSGLMRMPRELYYACAAFAVGTACGLFLEAMRQSHLVVP